MSPRLVRNLSVVTINPSQPAIQLMLAEGTSITKNQPLDVRLAFLPFASADLRSSPADSNPNLPIENR